MNALTIISFLFFTGLVAFITWRMTRKDEHSTSDGFFLGGRSLTFPFIAGSLLLTNLSTEQLVGLNGGAFKEGLVVMVWEIFAVLALVAMALFFLPRFLKSGITTVPEFLKLRYDGSTQAIANFIFLIAYTFVLLPIILYTGATGMVGILGLDKLLGFSYESTLILIAASVGIIGAIYALFGGLKTVAVSDTLNGIGLLVGGFLIVFFGLAAVGDGDGVMAGWSTLREANPEKFNPVGGSESSVPFSTIFTGVILLHLFYWCTNQQIIQRTLGAKSLAEGQKGIILTGALKLLGPLYLVIPGIIAYHLFSSEIAPEKSDLAYGRLVSEVLPKPLVGFFAAALLGAILSSFNSALNSTCTLFSLGLYKASINKEATQEKIVSVSQKFGIVVTLFAIIAAPLLASTGGIFEYLQSMNSIYFIPILAVIVLGFFHKRIPPVAANAALILGVGFLCIASFVPPVTAALKPIPYFHQIAIVFVLLILMMIVIAKIKPLHTPWQQVDAKLLDLTPWKHAKLSGVLLVIAVTLSYFVFSV